MRHVSGGVRRDPIQYDTNPTIILISKNAVVTGRGVGWYLGARCPMCEGIRKAGHIQKVMKDGMADNAIDE